jgi:hypothetical protein
VRRRFGCARGLMGDGVLGDGLTGLYAERWTFP